jgi:hypothetical protein
MDDQTWNLILTREQMVWADVQRSAGSVRECILDFSRYVQQPVQANGPGVPIINLDGKRRYEAIAMIAYVLNQKLKLRNVNGRYHLIYTRNGANADPYEVRFIWRNKRHRMWSNYDGNSQQVGNHRTETLVAPNTWNAIVFNYDFNIRNPSIDFLLMAEIARRKCYDPQLQRHDQYQSLPISFCVAIGIHLNQNNQLIDVLRGNNRLANSRRLLNQVFPNNFSFGRLCAVVYEYYELHDNL